MPYWHNAANAVVVPSLYEGFGLAVLEALACDVPVLATPTGVHPTALGGIDALVYAPGIGPLGRLVDTDAATWRRVFDTNVTGAAVATAAALHRLLELSHGIVLVTGPTGSGKTTTLYAVLSEVNTGLDKIITIEDPVEYQIPGIVQVPVNEKKGLTFTKPDLATFRDKLRAAGFYQEWREKIGADAWTLLEKHVGKLA